MYLKRPKLWFSLGILFVAFLVLAYFRNNYLYPKIEVPVERNSGANTRENSKPLKLKIPSLGVDAAVLPMGLTPKGAMEDPKDPMDTGWFELGPSPGETGNAVIAGHRGWKIGPAVFDSLHKIKIGDEVMVVNEKNEVLVFKVRETRVFGAEEKVPEVWFSESGYHLNLITCSGKRNILTGSSEKRLVVFTDLISSRPPL